MVQLRSSQGDVMGERHNWRNCILCYCARGNWCSARGVKVSQCAIPGSKYGALNGPYLLHGPFLMKFMGLALYQIWCKTFKFLVWCLSSVHGALMPIPTQASYLRVDSLGKNIKMCLSAQRHHHYGSSIQWFGCSWHIIVWLSFLADNRVLEIILNCEYEH
jgi:hypothetical protein